MPQSNPQELQGQEPHNEHATAHAAAPAPESRDLAASTNELDEALRTLEHMDGAMGLHMRTLGRLLQSLTSQVQALERLNDQLRSTALASAEAGAHGAAEAITQAVIARIAEGQRCDPRARGTPY